ncbi:hypothetical protein ACT1U9_16520 [Streptomyces sp. BR1]|uniref:hypothetical protein n=1 Tax=Streptomyces sp. BR1 TaxID=1592323 RepID=UPI00402B7C3A
MIIRQLLLCFGTAVALSPIGAQVYAGIGVCPVNPVPPKVAAPHVVPPRVPRAPDPVLVPAPDPVPAHPRVPPAPVTATPRPAAPASHQNPAPPQGPAPHPTRPHHAPYHPAAQQRPAPAGFSTVTLMLVVTTPAVLAAAVLRPRSRSGAR